jgi:hypothetical protein
MAEELLDLSFGFIITRAIQQENTQIDNRATGCVLVFFTKISSRWYNDSNKDIPYH